MLACAGTRDQVVNPLLLPEAALRQAAVNVRCSGMDLGTKVSAFCRELADSDGELARLAEEKGMTEVLENARAALTGGHLGAQLEADLDALDLLLKKSDSLGMYPPVTRGFKPLPGFEPLPGAADRTGAQWWTCPGNWCAGRGRVRPQQPAPVCAVSGQSLTSQPVSG
jgi:hypothetical protein